MSKGKELTGVLFKNDKKTTDKHPQYKGSCMIAGVEFWIAAWVNESDRGKYMSLKFEPKEKGVEVPPKQTYPSRQQAYDEDEVPF